MAVTGNEYSKMADQASPPSHKVAIVPITGFANAVVSPAMEFQSEGRILGTGAQIFSVAGPVILYGPAAAVLYGLILWIFRLF